MAASDSADRGSEFDRIAAYLRPLAAGHPAGRDLADDGALLPAAGASGLGWVMTTDTLVAGVHFLPADPPASLALKLLGVNLSDLAAMAATPAFYSLNLALPPACEASWWAAFATGLERGQARHGLHLVGGDCTATPGPAVVSATLFGVPPAAGPPGRTGLAPGQRLWISGSVGDAALGLAYLTGELGAAADGLSPAQVAHLVDRYRHPRPRWRLMQALRPWLAAAIDVSDGLIADLGHMAQASGVGARVAAPAVPLSPAATRVAARWPDAWPRLLTGGDDYEVLVAAPAAYDAVLPAIAATQGVALTPIGTVVSGGGVACYDGAGAPMALGRGGWEHGAGPA